MSLVCPDLRVMVDPLLGLSYAEYNCWEIVRVLLRDGMGIDVHADPQRAIEQFTEVWFRTDARDPLMLVQSWDMVILAPTQRWSQHVGLVVDTTTFVHSRQRVGVCLEPLQRWRAKLLQLARLRMLL